MDIGMFFHEASNDGESRYLRLSPFLPGMIYVECHDEKGPDDSDTVWDVALSTDQVEQLIDALNLMLKVVKP